MNDNQHTTERYEDRKSLRDMAYTTEEQHEVLIGFLKFAGKLLGAVLMIILGVMGWNLIATYNLNAQVAEHGIQLSNLQTDTTQIKTQVMQIYQSEILKKQNNDTADMSYYIPLSGNFDLGGSSTPQKITIQ